ncbi:hypothetical protein [Streptomyces sp. CHB9.2]|uniref:hypothetical protein n=1 Tax=Streptomyces sp. CHB9.2 TaxID=2841670 RepID=UPI0020962CCC|nr:hypothetical protein [Streptomyces sp. CHB9.2]MCO6704860.1 hypothetical protein [Streptomyces sp. CHB9.2]
MATATQIKDTDWIRQSFMLPRKAIANADSIRRTLTDARFKFTDTRLGGNFAINPPPQFTRYADLVVPSLYSKSTGQGRYYSEAIDDNAQLIHMRFGVPEFNSLTNFFFNFYNPQAATLARTGRANPLSFALGKLFGTVITLPLQLLITGGAALSFFLGRPTSKYYYLKPAMPLYWNAVNTIANGIAVNMGLTPRTFQDDEKKSMPGTLENTAEMAKIYHAFNPGIWHESGQIDVYSLATNAQRLANDQRDKMEEILETRESPAAIRSAILEYRERPQVNDNRIFKDFESYLSAYQGLNKKDAETDDGSAEKTGDTRTYEKSLLDFMEREHNDGGQWVTFNVEHTGTAAESFQSSVRESDISSKLNGLSATGRSARFSTADGQTGINPLDSVMSMVGSFIDGALDSIKLSGLMAFSGMAIADIPKMWESSSAQLPRMDYTIKLRTPYGNKFSRFCDLMVPLSMLLAAALPISTGKQSYTSPFLVELYSKGRAQTRLGMVESLSITRGTGNLGWTQDQEPLGIDVTFSVVDLSSIMHMPINAGFSLNDAAATTLGVGTALLGGGGVKALAAGASMVAGTDFAKGVFSEDTMFSDYLAILSSMSLTEQTYTYQKLRVNLAKQMGSMNTWFSKSHFANWFMNTTPARLFSGFAIGTGLG